MDEDLVHYDADRLIAVGNMIRRRLTDLGR